MLRNIARAAHYAGHSRVDALRFISARTGAGAQLELNAVMPGGRRVPLLRPAADLGAPRRAVFRREVREAEAEHQGGQAPRFEDVDQLLDELRG